MNNVTYSDLILFITTEMCVLYYFIIISTFDDDRIFILQFIKELDV